MRGIGLGALNTLVFLGVSASSAIFGALAELRLSVAWTYGLIFGTTAMALAIALGTYVTCHPKGCGAKDYAFVGLKATFRLPPTLVDAGATGIDTR